MKTTLEDCIMGSCSDVNKVATRKDITGLEFGRLVVVCQANDAVRHNGIRIPMWLARCSCEGGNFIIASQTNLFTGHTKSCGCLRHDSPNNPKRTHGKSKTKLYKVWDTMKQRCANPLSKSFRHYGGRGIGVCDRWLDSFENFLEDMGECPEGMSLDRIDVNGHYEPSNCRWATASEQGFNQRKSRRNTSGRTGVSWYLSTGKWTAQIVVNMKQIHLGTFTTFEEAVAAREKAEIDYYGYSKQ